MNNERQHSEYKIIETVATPTFDGISVETHPEDQLGGGDTPKETHKLKIAFQNYFVVGYEKDNIFSYYITDEGAALFNADGEVVGSKKIDSEFNNDISISLYYGGYEQSVPTPMQNKVTLGWKVSSWSEFKPI